MTSTPAGVRAAGEPPRHRVVARDPAAALERCAQHRVAHVRRGVEDGHHRLDPRRGEHLGVDAVQPDRVDPPRELAQVVEVVREVEHSALAQHDVEVELPAEPLVELQGVLVQMGALVQKVVRPDDGGVAAGVAAPQPALLEHRDVPDAVQLREVVRGREPVAAAAHDDDIVGLPGLGAAPRGRPALVSAECVAREGEDGVSHRRSAPPRWSAALPATGAGSVRIRVPGCYRKPSFGSGAPRINAAKTGQFERGATGNRSPVPACLNRYRIRRGHCAEDGRGGQSASAPRRLRTGARPGAGIGPGTAPGSPPRTPLPPRRRWTGKRVCRVRG